MKYLMDNIHGSVSLSPHEVDVIDHPLFQRLRYVKQNDILHLTFMGATHTRFSHSIGVMHVGTRIYDRLFPLDMTQKDARYFPSQQYMKKVIRLALLLHDTGHSAFSHLVEHMDSFQRAVYDKSGFSALWSDVNDEQIVQVAQKGVGSRLTHENFSVRCAYQILKDSGADRSVIWDTLSLMEGFPSLEMTEHFNQVSCTIFRAHFGDVTSDHNTSLSARRILHGILSGEADADKFDYIARDAHHAGVGYGNFDVEGIINSLSVCYDEDRNRYVVTVSETGLASLCDLVGSRFSLYRQITNNIGNNGVEVLFEHAIDEIMKVDEVRESILRRATDISCFQYFTDDVLMYHIGSHAMNSPESFCHRFINRNRMKHIETFRTPERSGAWREIKKVMDNHPGNDVIINEKFIKFSNISDDYLDIMVRRKKENGNHFVSKISEMTNFFDQYDSFWQYGCYIA